MIKDKEGNWVPDNNKPGEDPNYGREKGEYDKDGTFIGPRGGGYDKDGNRVASPEEYDKDGNFNGRKAQGLDEQEYYNYYNPVSGGIKSISGRENNDFELD